MKKLFVLILISPLISFSQSDDGQGSVAKLRIVELAKSQQAKGLKITSYGGETAIYKKGKLTRTFQWFNYKDTLGQTRRKRREYIDDYFMYDESLMAIPQTATEEILSTVRHIGKQVVVEDKKVEGGSYYVYDGFSKIYDDGLLQSTLFFQKGRPYKIYVNHYYDNGQLQFVREITSEGSGKPLKNTGALEAFYPDGSVFENPLTEDGLAIIILNQDGEPEDKCACMGQNIMEWGESYLFAFIGKYYYLLEKIYEDEEMDCCWE